MTIAYAVPGPSAGTNHGRRLGALVATLALLLAALVAGVATGTAAGANSASDDVTSRLNAARTSRGLPALTVRADLVDVAQHWAQVMASSDTLKHNPDLTTDVQNWASIGENVGYGPDSATVHQAFMDSDAHRANILDTDYTEVGVGAIVADGRVWVTEVFRKPMSAPTTSTPTTDAPAFPGKLTYGSTGTAVRRVQRRLSVGVSGFYGSATKAAVKRYQSRHGWDTPTGNVGRRTWDSLFG